MRICSIPECPKVVDSKKYCKNHYRSYMKYGNPLQIEENKRKQAERRKQEEMRKERRPNTSTNGTCSVRGCSDPIKARLMCEKHYARNLRNGTIETKNKRINSKIEECLVIGCERVPTSGGFCGTHKSYIQKFGTPYLAKTIKLCGVKGCQEKHWGKGMCQAHFNNWKTLLRKHGLD